MSLSPGDDRFSICHYALETSKLARAFNDLMRRDYLAFCCCYSLRISAVCEKSHLDM